VRGESKYSAKDAGFASQNILLCAEEEGIGSCVLCNIDRNKIKELLKIPKEVEVDSVIALGYKAEQPVIEDMKNSVKYWKDENDVLHVPKRKLEDIIHINRYVE
jgi:nitroreductase